MWVFRCVSVNVRVGVCVRVYMCRAGLLIRHWKHGAYPYEKNLAYEVYFCQTNDGEN